MKKLNYYLAVIVFLFVFSLICQSYDEYGYLSIDAYYQISLAQNIYNGNDHIFLPLTVYGSNFPNRHYLYQLILSPFSKFHYFWGPLFLSFFILITLYVVYYYLLKEFKCSYPELWSLMMIFSSPYFFFRMIDIRPLSFSLILLMVVLLCIRNRKLYLISIFMFFYALSYSGYILIFSLFPFLIFSDKENIIYYIKAILYTFIGILCAYFLSESPSNKLNVDIVYLYAKLSSEYVNPYIPSEWQPMSFAQFFVQYWHITILICYYLIHVSIKVLSNRSDKFIISIVLFYLFLTVIYGRAIDLLIPFSVLFLARLHTYYLSSNKINNSLFIPYLFIFSSIIITYSHHSFLIKNELIPINRIENASNWLENNTKKNELITLSNINSFAELLFHNRTLSYTCGMDWTLLSVENMEIAKNYELILSGVNSEISEFMKKINSNILFIDIKDFNEVLFRNALNDSGLELLYNDSSCYIFGIEKNSS